MNAGTQLLGSVLEYSQHLDEPSQHIHTGQSCRTSTSPLPSTVTKTMTPPEVSCQCQSSTGTVEEIISHTPPEPGACNFSIYMCSELPADSEAIINRQGHSLYPGVSSYLGVQGAHCQGAGSFVLRRSKQEDLSTGLVVHSTAPGGACSSCKALKPDRPAMQK